MDSIKTIDLWTERYSDHYECVNAAFVDGFENGNCPFDEYKVVKNCNCFITTNCQLNIHNKHQAICFYKEKMPVRLVVLNKDTDVQHCIENALNQYFNEKQLKDIYKEFHIRYTQVDLKEEPIDTERDVNEEIDVGSCDRWKLLYNMLKGSYTEDDTKYGNYTCDKYEFNPNLTIKYKLETDSETFEIDHYCAFVNETKTRIIPIQTHSSLKIQ